MNVLLVIGIMILLGTLGGRIFRKLNLPQVTGYIIIGLLMGKSFSGLLSGEVISSFEPLISLALGIIGFMIGSELQLERFQKYSKSIYTILIAETFLTFFSVSIVAYLMTGKVYMGLLLGALASATAPAATYSVLGEYKARGPVTTTAFSIVALDDALALIIYGFASVFARALIVHENMPFLATISGPLIQITISVSLGILAGVVLDKIAARTREKEKLLPIVLGAIILVVGLAKYLGADAILASMVLGAVAVNLQLHDNQGMFDVVKRFSPPIFILFFVLIGAKLDAKILMKGGVLSLAIVYILSRSFGKLAGTYIGGKISGAKPTVTKYLGFCLFDQAGVAVGLSIAAFNMLSGLGADAQEYGVMLISIITATTFILQIIAPPMIKYGITKADEINRNITEDDVIDAYEISDVMSEDFFIIRENNNLHQIIDIMKKSDSYNFPVTKMDDKFLGIISLGEIRDAFNEEQMDMLIMAGDLVREVKIVLNATQPLRDAMNVFGKNNKLPYDF